MKYNLGSGNCPIDGYENLDIKNGRAAYPLSIPDNSADEIRASHLLEHFAMKDAFSVIRHWADKLKDGGVLKIAVPNFAHIAKSYQNNIKDPKLMMYLMGGQSDEYDYHKSVYDRESLTQMMESAGLEDIKVWSDVSDCSSLPVSLNLMGKKKAQRTVSRTIAAVVSMPRLCFTDTMNCMMQELVARGIPVRKGCGVFWSQVLSRMIQDAVNDGNDYLLTIDYDSWFKYEHIQRLLSIMERNPNLDAVCAMQMKRECDSPLMGIVDKDGKPMDRILISDLQKDYLPIYTGHFGLTVFRCSALKKLKKPWFKAIPNEQGEWEDGRIDDDIYFWHNFKECGLNAGIAPISSIGHLQLVCTFPGRPEDGFKPIHVPINDLPDINRIPEHCR
jgi:predicted SAM-dependent methyltransferase